MKRLYARLVLWLIRPALELEAEKENEVARKEFAAFCEMAPWGWSAGIDVPILLDDPEMQSRLIQRAVFPSRSTLEAKAGREEIDASHRFWFRLAQSVRTTSPTG
ncbi:hypothetical protein [Cupriavidus sp. RAF12]|uniref:hypothetical protein n=1 Tax=Cupriavidus sp. RAF12 TaxID=3233050 RepID=UPI003F8EFB5F